MIGSTNLSGGGGVGSDELTATAANVLEETTYVGADTDDELAEGTMQHLTNRATITHTAENATKVIEGDAAFTSINSDGTARAEIRYNGTEGFITPNTLFAVPQGDMATAGGLTAEKLLEGQSAFGIAGTATSDATASATQILSGKSGYVKGSKITGTMADYSGKTGTGNYVNGTFRAGATGCVFASPGSTGYYTTGSYLRIPAGNLAAANIKKGVSILGIMGTFEGWVENSLVLYNNGSWNYISNGGVTGMKGVTNGVVMTPYRTVDGGNITYYDAIIRLNATFPLTSYNYVKVAMTCTGSSELVTGYVGVHSSANITDLNFYAMSSLTNPNGVCISNISSLSGNYYIYIGARSNLVRGYQTNVTVNTIVVSVA